MLLRRLSVLWVVIWVLAPAPAHADSLPRHYIGVQGGYGWSNIVGERLLEGIVDVIPQGFTVGGFAGYDVPIPSSNRAFAGIEAEINWTDIHGNKTWAGNVNDPPADVFDFSFGEEVRLNWLGMIRGRIGRQTDGHSAYFAGGFAIGDVEGQISGIVNGTLDSTPTDLNVILKATQTLTGYTLGGGFEMDLNGDHKARLDYSYVDLGQDEYFGADVGLSLHLVRFGILWGVGYE